jgi:hypothetical protein
MSYHTSQNRENCETKRMGGKGFGREDPETETLRCFCFENSFDDKFRQGLRSSCLLRQDVISSPRPRAVLFSIGLTGW